MMYFWIIIGLISCVEWDYHTKNPNSGNNSNDKGDKNDEKQKDGGNEGKNKVSRDVYTEFGDYCEAKYKFFGSRNNYNLEKVIVLFRHGDRSPLKCLSNGWKQKKCIVCDFNGSTIRDCDMKECNEGDLTIKGYNQAKKLGEFIKNNYSKYLFRDKIEEDEISYRVTSINRTHSTLMGVVEGFNNKSRVHNVKMMGKNDSLLRQKECQYLEQKLLQDNTITEEISDKLEKSKICSGKDVSARADEIRCGMCNDIAIEIDDRDGLYRDILNLSNKTWLQQMQNVIKDEKAKKILFGRFASDLIEELDNKKALSLISAHDGSIAMALTGLATNIQEWPPYAAALFIEVWCRNGNQYVRLVYNNKKIDFVKSSEEFIPLADFKEYLQSQEICNDDLKNICSGKEDGNSTGSSKLIGEKNNKNQYNLKKYNITLF